MEDARPKKYNRIQRVNSQYDEKSEKSHTRTYSKPCMCNFMYAFVLDCRISVGMRRAMASKPKSVENVLADGICVSDSADGSRLVEHNITMANLRWQIRVHFYSYNLFLHSPLVEPKNFPQRIGYFIYRSFSALVLAIGSAHTLPLGFAFVKCVCSNISD